MQIFSSRIVNSKPIWIGFGLIDIAHASSFIHSFTQILSNLGCKHKQSNVEAKAGRAGVFALFIIHTRINKIL